MAATLDFGGNSPRRQLRQLLQNRLQFSIAGGSSRRVISRHLLAGSAQLHTARLGGGQCLLGAARDHGALLLRHRRIDVEHERIDVPAQCGNDERHPLRHQPADKGDVAAKPIELRHSDFAFSFLSGFKRGLEFGTAIQSIATLAGLDLGELGDDGEAFSLGELGDGPALRFLTETGSESAARNLSFSLIGLPAPEL